MTETELIVIRHGESVWNSEGRQQGHLDSGLSDRGRAQAHAIANRVQGRQFAAIYSSDLGRALQTAEIIATGRGMTVLTDARLRERHLGVFEGLTWDEVRERYPAVFADYQSGGADYVIPGGESARQRFTRTVGCLEEIARQHVGQTIVVVTHGGVLNGLFRQALGLPLEAPRRFKLWNASLNVFYYRGSGEWQLGTWGDVSHLAALGTRDDG